MACFIVPTVEAVVTTVATKIVKAKENKDTDHLMESEQVQAEDSLHMQEYKIPLSKKLSWLSNMLWGGSALLAFEHIWHGEVTPWFPFLTAASNAEDTAAMLHEMATVGVMMAVLVTAVWGVLVAGSAVLEKRAATQEQRKNMHETKEVTE